MTTGSTTGSVPGEVHAGPIQRITIHWSAGTYTDRYSHYHRMVLGDAACSVVQTLPDANRGSHTWKRNSGNLGNAFAAMATGYPIKQLQIQRMAKLIAEQCLRYDIGLHGTIEMDEYRYVPDPGGNEALCQLVPTGGRIVVPTVADHEFYAIKDGYYPARVDVGTELMTVLKEKADWYFGKLQAGLIDFEYCK
jgi:hypothetical protein